MMQPQNGSHGSHLKKAWKIHIMYHTRHKIIFLTSFFNAARKDVASADDDQIFTHYAKFKIDLYNLPRSL